MDKMRRRTVMEMRSLAILTMLLAMALLGFFVKMFLAPNALQTKGLLSESRILAFAVIPCADAALLTLARLLWKYAANIKAQLLTPEIRERVHEFPANSSARWRSMTGGEESLDPNTPEFRNN